MRKKILFVINTMGRAGAETAMLELLKALDSPEYDISLYVIMGQGEMIGKLPPYVRLRNLRFNAHSVLSRQGKRGMMATVCRAFFRNGGQIKKIRGIAGNLASMGRQGKFQADKLLWRMLSDGSLRLEEQFDLAVAWLEGASAYYVAEHVKAARKAAFIHIDYESAGYTKAMDRGCWKQFDNIFAVSDEVKGHFQSFYPEYASKVGVFHNFINQEAIRSQAMEQGGFSDDFKGRRILTVGRLTYQKAYDIAVEAMKILKDAGYHARWYVLGEGEERKALEKKIAALGLQEDFLLLGAVTNPHPYYLQTDLYVHATRFEGKSIAIQEAQTLGCAVIASDCNGNREQITDGSDGMLCDLTPCAIAERIETLLKDEEKRKALGRAAKKKKIHQMENLQVLLGM